MIKQITLLLSLAIFLPLSVSAQCGQVFAGYHSMVETCSVSGTAGPYPIQCYLHPQSTDSIIFWGLWEEPQATTDARLHCANDSFSIAMQPFSLGGWLIEGHGTRVGSTINIFYCIYNAADSSQLDCCLGTFAAPFVGVENAIDHSLTVSLSPNPVISEAIFRINNSDFAEKPLRFELRNVEGKIVQTAGGIGSEKFRFERGDLQAGIYFYRFMDGIKQVASGKMLVR